MFVVGIGASAGGFDALKRFFSNVKPNKDIAYIVVQHLSRNYDSKLPQILQAYTTLKVVSAQFESPISPGFIYVIPPGVEIYISENVIKNRTRTSNPINKTIDFLFTSLAKEIGSQSIGIVFSGLGSDGLEGVRAIEKAGGVVLVQDPSTAQFSSMPNCIIKQDSPLKILPPERIPAYIYNFIYKKNKSIKDINTKP